MQDHSWQRGTTGRGDLDDRLDAGQAVQMGGRTMRGCRAVAGSEQAAANRTVQVSG